MKIQVTAAFEEQAQVMKEVNRAVSKVSTRAANINPDMEHILAARGGLSPLAVQVNQRTSQLST